MMISIRNPDFNFRETELFAGKSQDVL